MRPFAFIVAALVSSALGMSVTSPGALTTWTTIGPNLVDWDSVSTDPTSFKIVLTTRDLKTTELVASVNTNEGSMLINAPSGGFPIGSNYRVNLINLTTGAILAQSAEFSIAAGTGSVAATASAVSSASVVAVAPTTMVVTRTPTATTTTATGAAIDASILNPSETAQPTPGAASPAFKATSGLVGLVAVLYALVL